MVLTKNIIALPKEGKIASQWEGPYILVTSNRLGSYHLKDAQGKELPHPWNAENLKNHYMCLH